MNYESLIFDIDGTLWDSRALVAEGYNIQLKTPLRQGHDGDRRRDPGLHSGGGAL